MANHPIIEVGIPKNFRPTFQELLKTQEKKIDGAINSTDILKNENHSRTTLPKSSNASLNPSLSNPQ